MNIKQFKRLWGDYNFRYLYEYANEGRRIIYVFIICRKIYGPLPEARWKMLYFTKGSRLTGNSLPGASSC